MGGLARLLSVGLIALAGAVIGVRLSQPVGPASLPDFSALVARNAPAVVNVTVSEAASPDLGRPGAPEEWQEFFRRFFGGDEPPPPGPQGPEAESSGSGFILSPDGYVLTNRHVVAGAQRVTVRLADRREYDATVVGTDDSTDIAVLRIEDARDLPAVKVGDPARLRVGDWVLAIGSPFGFDHSVTAGIVSAKERSLPRDNYVPFIQTDVAINPGNSGGPLFNLDGEVIGVNAQIYSRTGGFMGLSFAVPIDVALDVADQIKTTGTVSRGWIGVLIQEVDRELAQSFGLDQPRGALVARVMDDSPAQAAGVQVGDVILRYAGRDLVYSSDLPPLVGRTRVGSSVALRVQRAGKAVDLKVTIAELPRDKIAAGPRPSAPPTRVQSAPDLGLEFTPLSDEQRKTLELAPADGGVLIRRVRSGAGRAAGLRDGDVLMSVDGVAVRSVEEVDAALADAESGQAVRLLVRRGGSPLWVALRLPQAPG